MSVIVLSGIVRGLNDREVKIGAVGGKSDFFLTFDYGFPLKCKMGDEITLAVQSVTPPKVVDKVARRTGDIEKGRPSIPGAK